MKGKEEMTKNNDKKSILDDMNVFFNSNSLFKLKELKTDIIDESDKYIINIDVPGVDKENINITYNEGYLNIYVSKTESNEEMFNYIKRERIASSISRRYYLGNVNEEKISAKLENGVLNIICKKLEEEPNKNIKIE
jgi:HSP20 family protein